MQHWTVWPHRRRDKHSISLLHQRHVSSIRKWSAISDYRRDTRRINGQDQLQRNDHTRNRRWLSFAACVRYKGSVGPLNMPAHVIVGSSQPMKWYACIIDRYSTYFAFWVSSLFYALARSMLYSAQLTWLKDNKFWKKDAGLGQHPCAFYSLEQVYPAAVCVRLKNCFRCATYPAAGHSVRFTNWTNHTAASWLRVLAMTNNETHTKLLFNL